MNEFSKNTLFSVWPSGGQAHLETHFWAALDNAQVGYSEFYTTFKHCSLRKNLGGAVVRGIK